MKLDFSLLAIMSTHTVELCQHTIEQRCFLSDLKRPDNFEKWDCSTPGSIESVFSFALILLTHYFLSD